MSENNELKIRVELLEKKIEKDHLRYVEEMADLKNSFRPALIEISKQLSGMIHAVRPFWMTAKEWEDFCKEDAERVKTTPSGESFEYNAGVKDVRIN